MYITIEIHCKNRLGGNFKIGYTKIDLEKRFFNEGYQSKFM